MSTQDFTEANLNVINTKQADTSMMSSPEIASSNCIVSNDSCILGYASFVSCNTVTSINAEQCSKRVTETDSHEDLIQKDVKSEIKSDCCNQDRQFNAATNKCDNKIISLEARNQGNIKREVVSNCCKSQNSADMSYTCVGPNRSDNILGIPNEQSGQTKQIVNDGQSIDGTSELTNISEDVLYVLSVVEEDMKVLGISRDDSGAENHHGLKNCQGNKSDNKDESSTDESDSSEDSSSSSSESSSDSSDSEEDTETNTKSQETFVEHPPKKLENEFSLSELADSDLLDIAVDDSTELTPLGEIESILFEEAVVIIESFENVPALDADSILFLENRTGFGRVFEIFGHVRHPHYCVRFSNEKAIKSANIEIGQTVYFAPDTKDLTNFVFTSKVPGVEGPDAIFYENDEAASDESQEFSDDEAEAQAKSKKKNAEKLKKRNEAHMKTEGVTDAATCTKKQRPSRLPWKKSSMKPTRPPHTSKIRVTAEHFPRGPPPRFGGQPYHPLPMGPPLRQNRLWFTGDRGPPRNFPPGMIPPPPRLPFQGGPPFQGIPPWGQSFNQPFQNISPIPSHPFQQSEHPHQQNQYGPMQTEVGSQPQLARGGPLPPHNQAMNHPQQQSVKHRPKWTTTCQPQQPSLIKQEPMANQNCANQAQSNVWNYLNT